MSKPQQVVTAGRAPTEPVDGRSGIRYKGGLSLHKRRLSGTWEAGTAMQTEKPQMEEP